MDVRAPAAGPCILARHAQPKLTIESLPKLEEFGLESRQTAGQRAAALLLLRSVDAGYGEMCAGLL